MRIGVISTGDNSDRPGGGHQRRLAQTPSCCWSRAGRCAAAPPWGQPRGSDSRAAGERQPRRGGLWCGGSAPRRTTSPPRPRPRRLTSPDPVPGLARHHGRTLCQSGRTMARSNTNRPGCPGLRIPRQPGGHRLRLCGPPPGQPRPAGFFTRRAVRVQADGAQQIMPRLKALAGKRPTPSCAVLHLRRLGSALSDMLDAAPGLPASSWPPPSMPLIELKLIGHGASTADMRRRRGEAAAAIAPGWWDVATRRLPARSWPCWGSGRCTCGRGEPGRPAGHVSRAPPDRGFSHTPPTT